MCKNFNIEDLLRDEKFWEDYYAEIDKIFLDEIEKSLCDCRFNNFNGDDN